MAVSANGTASPTEVTSPAPTAAPSTIASTLATRRPQRTLSPPGERQVAGEAGERQRQDRRRQVGDGELPYGRVADPHRHCRQDDQCVEADGRLVRRPVVPECDAPSK